jgi:hypothetical protein
MIVQVIYFIKELISELAIYLFIYLSSYRAVIAQSV